MKKSSKRDAVTFARWVEEQAMSSDWIRILYNVQPTPVMPKLQIVPRAA
jgi:hypothetical protein